MEKPTARDTRRIVTAVLQQALAVLLFAAQGVFTARWLGPEQKGLLSIATQTFGIASVLLLTGLPMSLAAQVSRGRLWGRGVVRGYALALGQGSVAAVLVAVLWGRSAPDAMHLAIVYLSPAVLAAGAVSLLSNTAYALGRAGTALVGSTTANMTLAVVYAVLWLAAPQASASWAIVAWVLCVALGGVLMAVAMQSWLRQPGTLDRHVLADTYRMGFRAQAGQLAQSLNMRLDVLILGSMAGAAAAGQYSVAVSVALLSQLVPEAVGLGLTKSFGAGAHSTYALERIHRLAYGTAGGVGAFLAVAAPLLVAPVFGERFAVAGAMAAVLALPWAVFGVTKLTGQYALHALGRAGYMSQVTGIALCVDVVLVVPLSHCYGAWGAVAATVVASLVGSAWNVGWLVRGTGSTVRRLVIPGPGDVRWALAQLRAVIASSGG